MLWDNFVSKAKNATFLFRRDFMDYHQDRFEDYSLMVYRNDKLIAIFPANVSNGKIYSHQGLTYGGLVVNESLKLKDYTACFKAILKHYKVNKFVDLQIKELPPIYSPLPNDEMRYLMYVLEAELVRRDVLSVLNLKHKLKLSKDRVSGNKRAIKQALVVREEQEFDSFWNEILVPNLKSKHAANPVHSLDEIKKLKRKFPKKIRQFNVYKNDVLVAGTTIFETKHVAHSQYISGNNDKNISGCLDFLHIYLIEEIFANKPYFDFGISNENQGKNVNQGLNYWKEGFGARTITQDFYKININKVNVLDSIFI